MLLPIILVSFLTFASALIDFLHKIPNILLDPLDKIPKIDFSPNPPEDASLSAIEIINKYGYNGETHNTITSDGYVLGLDRITGRVNSNSSQIQKPVALLMHGILCNSICWLFPGGKSLAFILADAGYDVWLGNARGTKYSREHVQYSSNEKDYWNFSWHEIGTQDLPAMIDYVLETTGREKLFYLGHSQGTTVFFTMASERPEYQSKIEAMFALAPIVFCGRMKSPFFQILSHFTISIKIMSELIGINEFTANNALIKKVQQMVCADDAITQSLCSNAIFLVTGFNHEQMDKNLIPIVVEQFPDSVATKQFIHYGQLINSGSIISAGKFKQYDHGIIANKKIYNQVKPPNYNLKKIQVPVVLHYSKNDWLANVKDVENLYTELGNPFGKFLVPDKRFNHIDFMWAKNGKELLYDYILDQMKQFLQ
ncbi:lipase 3-like [Pseudomyrmex gracilis]|uniref:lipase 3-like n=1 Tax=Pseudomyrmex gracilis TaxID=219809 RepID=UPI000995C48F|nr:lipase 3-like [Pseudomyrmex gracilis]